MKWSERLAHYNKAIESFFGVVIMVGTMLLEMDGQLPEGITKWVVTIVGIATVLRVWWVKNEPLLEDAADQIERVAESLEPVINQMIKPTEQEITQYVEPAIADLNNRVAQLDTLMRDWLDEYYNTTSGRHGLQ